MKTQEEALQELGRIGLRSGQAYYEEALDAAKRGWPAWRIAQWLKYPSDLIYRLGGPAPK